MRTLLFIIPLALILSGIVFVLCGSGKPLEWNIVNEGDEFQEEIPKPIIKQNTRSKYITSV